ncbi:peptidyl-prolyl cis-trans isomerase-like [Microplitis demolitor]|uniref:peptidyl-prolyl cis-trans isomerase-like n=1 Tax=Microplitis demolitor TaxID=69319 RepID=UPI00235B6784|nr:peptidyl-prolyl cis-trans isomerase-like [Microplitis demolitor]
MNYDHIKATINSKPIKLRLEDVYKPQVLEAEAKKIFEIDRENFELLKELYVISQTKGRVDCWRKVPEEDKLHNRYETKRQEYFKIDEQNKEIYDRLEKIYNRNKLVDNKKRKNKSKFYKIITKCLMAENLKTSTELISVIKNLKQRPRCYFELQLEESKLTLGKIIIELFNDVVPKTCGNFLAYCLGTRDGLSYKNTPFHIIIYGYLCQGGDVTELNGSGGASIYGDFDNENFKIKHDDPGVVSTLYDTDKSTNNSKFNLTFKKLQVLDNKSVVFGKVVSGLSNIYKIEACGTKIGKPKKKIIISNCGLY